MQGTGNDFVIIDSREENLSGLNLKRLAVDVCDRHFGVGADGLLVIWPSKNADVRMQILNPDGSEPEMCGNGIRCFAKYIYEITDPKKEVLSVETRAGIMVPALIMEKGEVSAVEVDMGEPKDEGEVELEGFKFRRIFMGNPHAVTFVEDLAGIDLSETGPKVENDGTFKDRTNVEFVRIMSDKEMEVIVWERGAGETLACGTGACASVAAAVKAGLCERRVLVHLPGGLLDIEWQESDKHVVLRGEAEKVFEGSYFYDAV